MQRKLARPEKHPIELGQISDLPDVILAQRFQIVPKSVFEGIAEALGVVLAKSLGEEPVELVECTFLVQTAVY